MFELIFIERETEKVVYAITDVRLVRYITGSEVGFVDSTGHIRASSFPQNEDLRVERIAKMTPERQQEIKDAAPENPVHLTPDEEKEMRETNKNALQVGIGAGRYTIDVREGSQATKAIALRDKGLNHAAIASELGLAESSVRQILSR
jgi:hypothetical protein